MCAYVCVCVCMCAYVCVCGGGGMHVCVCVCVCVRVFSFSPNDSKMITCSDDSTVRVWDFLHCHEEQVLRGECQERLATALSGAEERGVQSRSLGCSYFSFKNLYIKLAEPLCTYGYPVPGYSTLWRQRTQGSEL